VLVELGLGLLAGQAVEVAKEVKLAVRLLRAAPVRSGAAGSSTSTFGCTFSWM
jgi:hypothetical protein